MKLPEACTSLQDVRTAIDQLDQQVLALIAKRARYVRAAAQFKTSETTVRAPKRYHAMLHQRRQWAADLHLDPDVIEQIYRTLVDYFIAQELQHWQEPTSNALHPNKEQ